MSLIFIGYLLIGMLWAELSIRHWHKTNEGRVFITVFYPVVMLFWPIIVVLALKSLLKR